MYPVIKNYSIVREIGRGPMGVVYEAVDTKFQRTVALKVLHPHFCKDKVASDRFFSEAKAIAKIDHPNAVRILDFGSAADGHFISMDYVPGTNMDRLLKVRGALRPTITVEILRDIAEALSHIHHLNIVHGNIKPANILIHKQGKAMLSDFDLVHHFPEFGNMTEETIAGGSFFMAPEQMSGKFVTAASDMYSWAVCFFWILTGKLPYGTQHFPEIIQEIRNGVVVLDPILMANFPAQYHDILSLCLAVDPGKRINSAPELMRQFEFFKKERSSEIDLRSLCGDLPEEYDAPKVSSTKQSRLAKKQSKSSPIKMKIRIAVGVIAVFAAIGTIAVHYYPPKFNVIRVPSESRTSELTGDMPQPAESTAQTQQTQAQLPDAQAPAAPIAQTQPDSTPIQETPKVSAPIGRKYPVNAVKAAAAPLDSHSDRIAKKHASVALIVDSAQSLLDSFNILSPEPTGNKDGH